ncbi:DUF6785 family protein [Phycisphaerales bacterium AB-hyl4]|uniref:DUF6785 family protein n=1 Tax=Natronomicrosphaera hydrolytica TaxID=3242702 RepID=A0ABV4UB00_9BACT
MTVRAVLTGLLLGWLISATTYFNDFVISQTMLIGNFLPISVFGVAMLLLLIINPLLGSVSAKLPLRPAELAILVAVALAACGWPGSGFYRGIATTTALPAHWLQTNSGWRAAEVMSYVPGGSPHVAPGQVRDWSALAARLHEADPDSDAGRVAERFSAMSRRHLAELATSDRATLSDARPVMRAINQELIDPIPIADGAAIWQQVQQLGPIAAQALERAEARQSRIDDWQAEHAALREQIEAADDSDAAAALESDRRSAQRQSEILERERDHWYRHANRAVLAELFDDLLLPAPEGSGVLAAQGRVDPDVVSDLMQGRGDFSIRQVPWGSWTPVLFTWGGLAMLIGLASLALAVIVHPQWSRRELLPYPVARFVEEISRRDEKSLLPRLLSNSLFWYGFAALLALHLVNGLHAWFDQVPAIPRQFDFTAMRELFPNASRVPGSTAYFLPTVYPSVIAFAFFLTFAVSFSLGVSQLLFLMLGAVMIAQGLSFSQSVITAEQGNLLRFGAYGGIALMIAYTGRRYYLNVLTSSVGLPRRKDTPMSSVWAARLLAVCLVGAVLLLAQAGLAPVLAAVFVLLVMMMMLVLSRIVAETGAFFLQPWWMPVAVMTALFGIEAIGPTAFIVLAIASIVIVGDPREALMPYLTNALQIGERSANTRPTRVAPWLAIMVVTGFVVAGVATFTLQYQHGVAGVDTWTNRNLPSMPFGQLNHYLAEMNAYDTLTEATTAQGLERLSMVQPMSGAVPWTILGLVLVVTTAAARLRLPWWPLHPVAFLVWGSYPIQMFAASFLLGCLVKVAIVKFAGTAGYSRLVPLMVGVIAGELSAGLLWMIVGGTYYGFTGITPARYAIFPG